MNKFATDIRERDGWDGSAVKTKRAGYYTAEPEEFAVTDTPIRRVHSTSTLSMRLKLLDSF